ncbi:sodium/potassium/calcium exchanger 4-like isoform X3 [Ptychodera flava]
MAFGSSAPEFLTALISTLIESGDIGYGTVIGSAAFNVLLIPGVCGMIAFGPLSWWPIVRDTTYYALGVLVLIIMSLDLVIQWYEALILVCMYSGYIFMMYYNREIGARVIPVVEKYMCTSDEEKQASLLTENGSTYDAVVDGKVEMSKAGTDGDLGSIEKGNEVQKDEEKEKTEEENYSPFKRSDNMCDNCLCVFGFPIHLAMYITTPDCKRQSWASWYPLTFLMSTVWMGIFCYVAVKMVDVIGYIAGIPDVVMGLTFLAIGSSLPDLILSIIVARQGLLDMALANAIGSNVFDILICLGVPALTYGIISLIKEGNPFTIDNVALVYITVMLLASILLNAIIIAFNGWKLNKVYGGLQLAMYFIYLGLSIALAYIYILQPAC